MENQPFLVSLYFQERPLHNINFKSSLKGTPEPQCFNEKVNKL